ncbi:MAG: hypothetical protein K5911_06395, partial [Eubacteriales bacterium]|nr:hypothetical protein [Eubacteriales bacterium]
MKRRLLILIMLALILVSACACGSSEDYSSYREVYNVDYKFYFYIPPQYADSLTKLGSGENSEAMIVRYTRDAYALVNVKDIYDGLTYEETQGMLRENYTIGDPSLDDTYNDRVYMQQYFTDYLSNSGSYKDIARVKKVEVNGNTFWFCHCYYYDSDPASAGVGTNFNGEGYLYFTIYDGITYFINITSVDSFLKDTPEAETFMSNFYLGIRMRPIIYVMWAVAGLLVLGALSGIFFLFVKLNVEPAVIIEIIKKRLDELLRGSYRSVHDLDNDEGAIVMDRILGRTDYDVTPEDAHNEANLRQSLYLDEILGRLEHLDASPLKDDGETYPERTVTVKNFPDLAASPVLSGLRDIYGGTYNEETAEEKLGISGMLDVILGRRKADEPAPFVQAAMPSNAAIGLMKAFQKASERSSESRDRREERSLERTSARIQKEAEKAERKLSAVQAKEEARYSDLYAKLDEQYASSAFATHVLDIIKEPRSPEEILFNLDTIFGRTLTSKLDNILERNVFTAKPIYFGTYEEQLAMRQKAVSDAADARRLLEGKFASRIAPSGGYKSPYLRGEIGSPRDSESNEARDRIFEGVYDVRDDTLPAEYTPRSFEGPSGYAFYVKAETALQNLGSAVAGLFRFRKEKALPAPAEELREDTVEIPEGTFPEEDENILSPEELVETPSEEILPEEEETVRSAECGAEDE